MKNIKDFITEKYTGELEGSSFKDKVKYSKKDFDKWVELWRDDKLSKEVMISPYSKDTELPFMGGTLNCHAAGTVEDPFDTYDMSCCVGY